MDLETAESFTDDYAEKADRYVARATAKALISIAESLNPGDERDERSARVW